MPYPRSCNRIVERLTEHVKDSLPTVEEIEAEQAAARGLERASPIMFPPTVERVEGAAPVWKRKAKGVYCPTLQLTNGSLTVEHTRWGDGQIADGANCFHKAQWEP